MPADLTSAEPTPTGSHIEIAGTHATVRVHGRVDQSTLRTVLQWLER